jgi:hypothetical protein
LQSLDPALAALRSLPPAHSGSAAMVTAAECARAWAAPYALVPLDPDVRLDDYAANSALSMAFVHNVFIRSLNKVRHAAPSVGAAELDGYLGYVQHTLTGLHEHHRVRRLLSFRRRFLIRRAQLEEEIFFPRLEEKLGAGALSHNVEEHHAFAQPLEELDDYVKRARADRASQLRAHPLKLTASQRAHGTHRRSSASLTRSWARSASSASPAEKRDAS